MIKHNQTAITSAQAAVGDQRGIARGRGLEEPREAAACPAGRAAVAFLKVYPSFLKLCFSSV